MRDEYKFLFEILKKKPLRRDGLRFEDKIQIIQREGVNWVCLAHVRLKMVTCEDGNELSAKIKGKEFYSHL